MGATVGHTGSGKPGTIDWRAPLPVLQSQHVRLREVRPTDAAAFHSTISDHDVQKYLPPGPASIDAWARFIRWMRAERRAGRYLCFAIIPSATGSPAGIFQLWPFEHGFHTTEFGVVLGRAYWGTGLFQESARLAIDFAVDVLGTRRLEARVAVANSRGCAAMLKLGAVAEGTLRECFPCANGFEDHIMWSILAREWRHHRARAR